MRSVTCVYTIKPRHWRSLHTFTTWGAHGSSRRRSTFRCAAIRAAVVRWAGRSDLRNQLCKVSQPQKLPDLIE